MKARTALAKEEDKQRASAAKEIKRLQAQQLQRQRTLESQVVAEFVQIPEVSKGSDGKQSEQFDVFISHASEDKDELVRELAQKSTAAGLKVFYDELTLSWGDSLRSKIEFGLANSRFGVVVLSDAFFKKEWPQRELDGLFNMEIEGKSRILPIWHKISKDEVVRRAPILSNKLALNTANLSVDEIVEKLVEIVKKI